MKIAEKDENIKYTDSDLGISFMYPASWELTIPMKQTKPYAQPKALIKRILLEIGTTSIAVDVFDLNGRDFTSWLKDYSETRSLPDLYTSQVGKIAGQDARFYKYPGEHNPLYAVFFGDALYAYRISNMVPAGIPALPEYWHLLDTFTLPNSTAPITEIPSGLRVELPTHAATAVLTRLTSCCGRTCAGNPFDCCSDQGNCVWYVYYRYCSQGGVPYRGNAGTWWSQRWDYPGWWFSSTPPVGNESIYQTEGDPGHVAYISNYAGGATVYITEMSWCASCFNARTINITETTHYLFKCNGSTPCPI